MLPPLGSLLVIAVKDSAIASVIAVPELIRQTQVLVSNTYLSFQLYTFTMIVYFLICYPLARARRSALSSRRPSGGVMTFDWSVVWDIARPVPRGRRDDGHADRRHHGARHSRRACPRLPAPHAHPACAVVATAFVEFFRATPLVLQIYWAYYVLPVLVDIRLSAVTTALIGLVCNISAFNSETFRAGILSIRQGQVNAGAGARHGRARRSCAMSCCRRR